MSALSLTPRFLTPRFLTPRFLTPRFLTPRFLTQRGMRREPVAGRGFGQRPSDLPASRASSASCSTSASTDSNGISERSQWRNPISIDRP